MGGGPRTFPGGLNKWQWKRLHEKKAKEKEKRLLDQEKQLYQARVRSQIRAKLAGKPDPSSNLTKYNPMSPNDHIKALADRFMKEGAEDLWNENDGPLKSDEQERPRFTETARNQRSRLIHSPLDLKQLISDNGTDIAKLGSVNGTHFVKSRGYSVHSSGNFRVNESSFGGTKLGRGSKDDPLKQVGHTIEQRWFRKNESSSSHHESDFISNDNSLKRFSPGSLGGKGENVNFQTIRKLMKSGHRLGRRFRRDEIKSSSSDDELDSDLEDEVEGVGGWRDIRKLGNGASLGKFDMKITERVPLKELEKEDDFSEQVELLRKDLGKNKLAENEGDEERETIDNKKRFDECGLSPLTIKALSVAGYFQMTRVQEATHSVCLEAGVFNGKD